MDGLDELDGLLRTSLEKQRRHSDAALEQLLSDSTNALTQLAEDLKRTAATERSDSVSILMTCQEKLIEYCSGLERLATTYDSIITEQRRLAEQQTQLAQQQQQQAEQLQRLAMLLGQPSSGAPPVSADKLEKWQRK